MLTMANRNSAFEEVSRAMITELQKDMCDVKKDLNELKTVYINRLPVWGSTLLMVICGILGITLGSIL
jgi:hypothetical protein